MRDDDRAAVEGFVDAFRGLAKAAVSVAESDLPDDSEAVALAKVAALLCRTALEPERWATEMADWTSAAARVFGLGAQQLDLFGEAER